MTMIFNFSFSYIIFSFLNAQKKVNKKKVNLCEMECSVNVNVYMTTTVVDLDLRQHKNNNYLIKIDHKINVSLKFLKNFLEVRSKPNLLHLLETQTKTRSKTAIRTYTIIKNCKRKINYLTQVTSANLGHFLANYLGK